MIAFIRDGYILILIRSEWNSYLNYADASAKVIEGYGATNVQALQAAKRKYDPKNVFGTLVKGGFKVPE